MFAYQFEYDGVKTTCNPSGRWVLRSDVPEGCAGFRTVLDGTLTFSHADYAFLKAIEDINPYNEIVFVIYEDTIELWRGSFSIVNCEVSGYHGAYRVTPKVIDKYSEMLNDWERERDIFKQNIARRDFAIVEESGFEYYDIVETVNLFENNGFSYYAGNWYANNVLLPLGQFWNSFASTKYLGFTTNHEYYMPALYNDAGLTSLFVPLIRTGSGSAYLPAGSLNQQWMYIGGTFTHLGGDSYQVTTHLARKVDITLDIAGIAVMPSDNTALWDLAYSEAVTINGQSGRKWYMKADAFQDKYSPSIFTYRTGATVKHYMELLSKQLVDRTPRYLKDVMAWFASEYGLNKTEVVGPFIVDVIDSELLTNKVNPVTGNDNELYYAVLVHNAEISNEVEQGREGLKITAEVTLKDMLISICNNFNALWDIVDGFLKIEHISYWFDLAASQDLTAIEGGIYTEKLQNYVYDDNIGRREIIQHSIQADQMEFNGLPIEYSAFNVRGNSDNTTTHNIPVYGNSIDKVIDSDLSDGLTLVLLELVPEGINIFSSTGSFWNPITVETTLFKPIFRVGLLTGLWYVNEPMTMTRIMDDYHKYFRPLQLGTMNTIAENFEQSGYIKKQDEIRLPIDIRTIAMYKLYGTELGYGRCTGFEFDSVNRTTNLKLIHKTNV